MQNAFYLGVSTCRDRNGFDANPPVFSEAHEEPASEHVSDVRHEISSWITEGLTLTMLPRWFAICNDAASSADMMRDKLWLQ